MRHMRRIAAGIAVALIATIGLAPQAQADHGPPFGTGHDNANWANDAWITDWKFSTQWPGEGSYMKVWLDGRNQGDGLGMVVDRIVARVMTPGQPASNGCYALESGYGAVQVGVLRIKNYHGVTEWAMHDFNISNINGSCRFEVVPTNPIRVDTNRAKVFMRVDKFRTQVWPDQTNVTGGYFFCRGGYANEGCDFSYGNPPGTPA